MRKGMVVGLFILGGCLSIFAQSQQSRPWWVGLEFGDGQLKLSSDQRESSRGATFAFGAIGGHRLGDRARIGVQVNGWLLQASNFNDPTVGENVSTVMGVVDVFPVKKVPLFLRGGAGLGTYTNNRPDGYGGNGLAWTGGAGYEIPMTKTVSLAPIVSYAAGNFGDVRNPLVTETGRRYSVIEFKVAAVFHFGSGK